MSLVAEIMCLCSTNAALHSLGKGYEGNLDYQDNEPDTLAVRHRGRMAVLVWKR